MLNQYKDTITSIDTCTSKLNKYDKSIFMKGYVTCLYKLLEQIIDSKYKISNKILGSSSKKQKLELQSRLYLLDIYEKHYSDLIKNLEGCIELQL